MTTRTLNRSGLLLIVSGALLATAMLFHPDMAAPGYAAQPRWVIIHIVLGISALAALGGLAGLFGVMHLKLTSAGKAAFVLAMLGNVLLSGIMFFYEASVLPVLSGDPSYQALASRSGPLMTGTLGAALMLSMSIAATGYLFLAGYLVASKTISPANGVLFIGAPLLFFTPPLTFGYGFVGGLVLGAGIIWLGVSILTGLAHKSLASNLRMQDECFAHIGGHA